MPPAIASPNIFPLAAALLNSCAVDFTGVSRSPNSEKTHLTALPIPSNSGESGSNNCFIGPIADENPSNTPDMNALIGDQYL